MRRQAAIDIALDGIRAGQTPKAVMRGTTGFDAVILAGLALGALGGVLGGLLTKDLYLVLTEDWIAVVRASVLTGRPNRLVAVGPRDAGAIVNLRIARGRMFSTVALRLPGWHRPVRLRVHSAWREDLEAFVSELAGGVPAASLVDGIRPYGRRLDSQRIAGGIVVVVALCVLLGIFGYIWLTKRDTATPAPSADAQASSTPNAAAQPTSTPPLPDQQVTPPARLSSTLTLPPSLPAATSGLAFSPDGRTLAVGSETIWLRVFDLATHRSFPIPDHAGVAAFSPNGKLLAAGSLQGTDIWNVRTRQQVASIPNVGRVDAMAYSRDGRTLTIVSSDSRITVWDVAMNSPVSGTQLAANFHGSAVSPDGAMFACTWANGPNVGLWNLTTGTLQASFRVTDLAAGYSSLRFTPDSATLITSQTLGKGFWLERFRAGAPPTFVSSGSDNPMDQAPVSNPNSTILAYGRKQGPPVLCSAESGRPTVLAAGTPPFTAPQGLAFSPDGSLLAAQDGSGVASVRLWNVATHHQIATMHE